MISTDRPQRRQAKRAVAAAAGLLAIGAVYVAATGFGLTGGSNGEWAGGGLPPATATVVKQTLVDTQTETGTLGYGSTSTLSARVSGTVTSIADTGATISRGDALYRLDNQPVVLLYGSLPAYRALSAGTEGADVNQFERNLSELGYTGFTVDETYTWATAQAVQHWQQDLGLEQTGTVELGRVVYAAGQVRVDAHKTATGDAIQPGTAILTYAGTTRVVTVDLDVADQRLAQKSATVRLTLPDGRTATGKIIKAVTVITTGEGGDATVETKIEVTVTVDDDAALAGLDQASVKVAFTAGERKDVLTVPVAALLALAEGGYGVQIVEGSSTRTVAVKTGLFAGGRVEVFGDGLTEGMTVGVPS